MPYLMHFEFIAKIFKLAKKFLVRIIMTLDLNLILLLHCYHIICQRSGWRNNVCNIPSIVSTELMESSEEKQNIREAAVIVCILAHRQHYRPLLYRYIKSCWYIQRRLTTLYYAYTTISLLECCFTMCSNMVSSSHISYQISFITAVSIS